MQNKYPTEPLKLWISIIVAIASLEYGKWVPNAGAIARAFLVALFIITVGI